MKGSVRVFVGLFVVFSLILAIIGSLRLGTYLYLYGLSYEKFFAMFTSLFVCYLLVVLGVSFFRPIGSFVKVVVVSAVASYGVLTMLPLEYLMTRANIAWSHEMGSRIDVNELQDFGADVYDILAFDEKILRNDVRKEWSADRLDIYAKKPRYASTLSDMTQDFILLYGNH